MIFILKIIELILWVAAGISALMAENISTESYVICWAGLMVNIISCFIWYQTGKTRGKYDK